MNNQAPELSPEARRLINEARGADDPTSEDHARVKARWLASVAAIAGVSSLTEAARAAGGIGWGFKAAGLALAIAAGAIGLNFALEAGDSAEGKDKAPLPGWNGSSPERFQKTASSRSEPEKTAHATGSRAVVDDPARAVAPSAAPAEPAPAAPLALGAQPQVAEGSAAPVEVVAAAPDGLAPRAAVPQTVGSRAGAAVPAASQPAVSQPAVSQSAVRTRPASRAAVARASVPKVTEKEASPSPAPVEAAPAAAGPSGQLSEELSLLSEVRSSIQEGTAARALELLSRYESRFGQPILGMEADALRVDALCKAGRREAARESARAFQNEWPGSPLERRVSAACP